MPRQNAFIPVSKGIDQRLDERLRSPDSLTSLINGEYHRNDAVRKRHGFTALTTSIQGGGGAINPATFGAPKALLSTGEELLIRGSRQLYAYQEGSATWSPSWWFRGELSPFTGKQRSLFADQRSVGSCDVVETTDGVLLHAETVWNWNTSGDPAVTALCFSAELPDQTIGINKFPAVTTIAAYNSTDADLDISGCKLALSKNGVGLDSAFVGVQRNTTFTFLATGNLYGTLQFYRWDTAAPLQVPTLSITHSDLYYPNFGRNYRRYDTCSTGDGWSYAYLRDTTPPVGATTNVIALYRKNDAVTVATITIAPPAPYDYWVNVAIHSSSTNNNTYVVASAVDAATGNVATYAYARNKDTLAAVWGPVQIANQPGAVSPLPQSVGVVEGADSNSPAVTRVVFVWSNIYQPVAGVPARFTQVASLLTNGTSQQNHVPIWHAFPVSKPWFRSGRCYMAVCPSYLGIGSPGLFDGYAGEAIVDCGVGDPEDLSLNVRRRARMVGRYNYGVAAGHQTYGRIDGSLQTVQASGLSIDRYATHRIINGGSIQTISILGADEVEVDFSGKTTNAATTRGTGTVGGGSVSWYASCVTEELGWCSAPFVADTNDLATAGAALSPGTYSYICVFESYDEKGALTRSTPGPVATHTVTGMHNSVELRVCTLGPTQRYDKRRFGVAVYRADSDGLFQRCIETARDVLDDEQSAYFDPIIVDKGGNFDILYTQGGAEVEAAGPDGAAFVTTTSKRVWLAGFFRRDRVQYSKPYDPSTASEYALAPEFNDAFAFLLPGGEACTGLIEMDDKVIVFTESSIFAIAGNGPDDGGRNNDFSGLQLVSSDAGCVDPRSLVATPMGVFFQAPSGMFLLGRDLQVNFIGARVRDLTDVYSEVTSAVIVPAANHVRFTCRSGGESIILCYDFDQNVWLRWDPRRLSGPNPVAMSLVGACLHDGKYHVLEANGTVYYEDPTTFYDAGSIYIPLSVETSWLQAAEQSGWQRIRTVAAMCERLDNHDLTMTLTQDFGSSTQTYTWTSATIADQKLKELVEMRTQVQKCTAFKIAISDAAPAGLPAAVTGQGVKVLGFQVELSGKRGIYKPGTQQRN